MDAIRGLIVLAVALVACEATPVAVDPVGSWGGEGIALVVTPDGGSLDFDCAAGTFDDPLPDPLRSFTVGGTFTLGFGGPDIEGREPDVQPATWTGAVRGGELTLTGVFGQENTPLGPYRLRKGEDPLLRRCQ